MAKPIIKIAGGIVSCGDDIEADGATGIAVGLTDRGCIGCLVGIIGDAACIACLCGMMGDAAAGGVSITAIEVT